MNLSRKIASAAVAALLTVGLAACGTEEAPKPQPTQSETEAPATETPESTETPAEEETPEASEEPTAEETTEEAAPAGDGTKATWAKDITVFGDLLTTIEAADFKVEVYQVAIEKATKTGNFVDPDTNKPLIEVGDDVVYLNYVVTNTGDKEIPLSYSLVAVDAKYDDWKWMQGMDSITDSAIEEKLGLSTSAIAPKSGEAPFAWLPGEQFAFGTNFKHQAGSPITFEARLTPALADGKLNHDAKVTAEGKATIK